MIRIITEQRVVYRAVPGRRARLTRKAAYADAAWFAFRCANPCGCEEETGFVCGCHDEDFVEHARNVVARLARWLMWRDRRVVEIARTTGLHFVTGTATLSPEAVREILGTARVVLRVNGAEVER